MKKTTPKLLKTRNKKKNIKYIQRISHYLQRNRGKDKRFLMRNRADGKMNKLLKGLTAPGLTLTHPYLVSGAAVHGLLLLAPVSC